MDKKIEELADKFALSIVEELNRFNSYSGFLGCKKGFIKGYETALEDKWISVEDRLPEDGQRVIYYTMYGTGEIHMGSFLATDQWSRKNYFCDGAYHHVSKTTHWMPQITPPIQKPNK